ncbi:MAG: acetolactate synthase small subunit [Rikenellaceae bacterium]
MVKEFIVIVFSENQIGVLNRITACYLRRKINIESLKVSESTIKGISMFVISAFATEEIMDKTVKQISNIIDVIEVKYYSEEELITQEVALYKVPIKVLSEHTTMIADWKARIVETSTSYVVLEATGTRAQTCEFREYLQNKGLLMEFTRSGSIVMHRDDINELLKGI